MPLYDYACNHCHTNMEVFHKMAETWDASCTRCKVGRFEKQLSDGFVKRPDAPWIDECANGIMNDLERVHLGKEERITTREQARGQIKALYKEPYPRPKNGREEAANKRVGLLRQRYLERY